MLPAKPEESPKDEQHQQQQQQQQQQQTKDNEHLNELQHQHPASASSHPTSQSQVNLRTSERRPSLAKSQAPTLRNPSTTTTNLKQLDEGGEYPRKYFNPCACATSAHCQLREHSILIGFMQSITWTLFFIVYVVKYATDDNEEIGEHHHHYAGHPPNEATFVSKEIKKHKTDYELVFGILCGLSLITGILLLVGSCKRQKYACLAHTVAACICSCLHIICSSFKGLLLTEDAEGSSHLAFILLHCAGALLYVYFALISTALFLVWKKVPPKKFQFRNNPEHPIDSKFATHAHPHGSNIYGAHVTKAASLGRGHPHLHQHSQNQESPPTSINAKPQEGELAVLDMDTAGNPVPVSMEEHTVPMSSDGKTRRHDGKSHKTHHHKSHKHNHGSPISSITSPSNDESQNNRPKSRQSVIFDEQEDDQLQRLDHKKRKLPNPKAPKKQRGPIILAKNQHGFADHVQQVRKTMRSNSDVNTKKETENALNGKPRKRSDESEDRDDKGLKRVKSSGHFGSNNRSRSRDTISEDKNHWKRLVDRHSTKWKKEDSKSHKGNKKSWKQVARSMSSMSQRGKHSQKKSEEQADSNGSGQTRKTSNGTTSSSIEGDKKDKKGKSSRKNSRIFPDN